MQVRVPDAVRVHRVVRGGDARVRAVGAGEARDRVHRRRELSGDVSGRVDDDPVRAEDDHLLDQQRRVHDRGGDTRRAVQRDKELELHWAGGCDMERGGRVLDDEGEERGGAGGGD